MSLGLLSAYSSSDEEDDDGDNPSLDSANKPVVQETPSPLTCDNISLEQITSVTGPYNQKEECQATRSQPSSLNSAAKSSKGYGLYEDEEQQPSQQEEEHHPYEKVDFFIPERKQRIPGKYLRAPDPAPAEVAEDGTAPGHQDGPCGELLPGMGTREFKQLKEAVWKDITTTGGSITQPATGIQFNTPSRDLQVDVPPAEDRQEYTEDDYYNYYLHHYYQYYASQGYSCQSWPELSDQYSAWISQYGGGPPGGVGAYPPGGGGAYPPGGGGAYPPGGGVPGHPGPRGGPGATGHIKQKTFEELLEQDRQLEKFFSSAPNEYTMMRAAFKSTFRGTKTYRENNKEFNPSHFNQLTKGAKGVKNMFPKVRSAVPDRGRYVPEKEHPENLEPKSNKQRKKEAWRAKMKSNMKQS